MEQLPDLNRATAGAEKAPPVKILQFGEGNFLRAFVDWMIDILNEQTSFNGSVNIIQPIPGGMVEVLNKQDGLYHVVLEGIKEGKPFKEYWAIKLYGTKILTLFPALRKRQRLMSTVFASME